MSTPRSKERICFAVGAVLIVGASLLFFKHIPPVRSPIFITIKTNGFPYLMGIPLRKGFVRDSAFRAIRWSSSPIKVKWEVDNLNFNIPQTLVAGAGWDPVIKSNVFETVGDLKGVGLIPKPKAPKPGPFE